MTSMKKKSSALAHSSKVSALPQTDYECILVARWNPAEHSYKENYRMAECMCGSKLIVHSNSDHLSISIYNTVLHRYGNKFYTKTLRVSELAYRNDKLYVQDPKLIFKKCKYFIDALELDWLYPVMMGEKQDYIEDHIVTWVTKVSIFKDIFYGKITSQEALYKAVLKKCFRMPDLEVKLFKEWARNHGYLQGILTTLEDLKCFTTSVSDSLKVLIDLDYSKYSLVNDLLCQARQLNVKVNLKWSDKRMNEEHLKMTRLLMFEDIASKSEEQCFSTEALGTLQLSESLSVVNTEKRAFLEGMEMCNCVYTNYFQRIKNNNYMVLHYHTKEEDCSIGIYRRNHDIIQLDQVFGPRNSRASEAAHQEAQNFIDTNKSALLLMLKDATCW